MDSADDLLLTWGLDPRDLLTVSDAARDFGIDRRTIQRWVNSGKLTKSGARVRRGDVMERCLESRGGRPLETGFVMPLFESETQSEYGAPFCFGNDGLRRLSKVLAAVVHYHVSRGAKQKIQDVLMDAVAEIGRAEEINQKHPTRSIAKRWRAVPSETRQRLEAEEKSILEKERARRKASREGRIELTKLQALGKEFDEMEAKQRKAARRDANKGRL